MAATNQRGGGGGGGGRGGANASAAMRRAMMPDEDAQTRFLRELAQRLPLDRVVEAHVFPPIRQGGMESGVAVIAVRREDAGRGTGDAVSASSGAEPAVEQAAAASDAGGAPPHGEVANDSGVEPHPRGAGRSVSSHAEPPVESDPVRLIEAQAADAQASEPSERDVRAEETEAAEGPGGASPDISRLPLPASRLPDRHTVFSARYRLTLKGPDRGKWEVAVVEEADAPLVTVDAVVRGVQRRAGEGSEPERFTAEQLRALVEAPAGAP